MKKKYTNEQLTAALLTAGSIRGAAKNLNISERAVYERMKDKDFQTLYAQTRNAIIDGTTALLTESLTEAVKTALQIMQKSESEPMRLQAAQTILKYGVQMNNGIFARREKEDTDIDPGNDILYSLYEIMKEQGRGK